MNPLSIKAQVQADKGRLANQLSAAKGQLNNQLTIVKALGDEARKKDLHEIKLAKEHAKAKQDGLPPLSVPRQTPIMGAADGSLRIPKPGTMQPDTVMRSNAGGQQQPGTGITVPKPGIGGPSTTLKNPEAGPSDTIPVMLTPGEAVIPASVAQDSAYKPVIEALVAKGRQRNRQPGGVKAGQPRRGFADGTLGDQDVMNFESGGDPLAKNPKSSASGLYQMTNAARADVLAVDPSLGALEWKDPAVQAQYRDRYKEIISERLKQSGITPTPDNVNRAWVTGIGGMQKIVANPDAPLAQTLGQKVVDINPNLQGKTGADFLNDPNPYSRKGGNPGMPTVGPGALSQEDRAELLAIDNGIAAPGTDANTRGQMRLKRAEILRKQGDTTVPNFERNYQGQGGGEIVPVPFPSTAKLADTAPPKIDSSGPTVAVVPPPVSNMPLTKNQLLFGNQIGDILQTPEVKSELAAAQSRPPPPGEEPKSWLAKQIATIFGPKGMFNDEELIRFSLLAAGGILTGGRVDRSIRFAGLSTLRASDERRANQTAADAKIAAVQLATRQEAFKNVRERNEAMEKEYRAALDKATPEARMKAEQLYAEAWNKPMEQRLEPLDAAIRMLGVNPIVKDTSKPSGMGKGFDSKTGERIDYRYSAEGNPEVYSYDNRTWVPAGKDVMTESQWNKRIETQKEMAQAKIEGALNSWNKKTDGSPRNKDWTAHDSTVKAKQLVAEMESIKKDLGHDISPESWATITEQGLSGLGEEFRFRHLNDLTPEELRRAVVANGIITLRQSNKDLYQTKDENGKPARVGHLASAEYLTQLEASHAAHPGEPMEKLTDRLENTFKGLPAKVREGYTAKAKEITGEGKRTSGYLLWVRDAFQANSRK